MKAVVLPPMKDLDWGQVCSAWGLFLNADEAEQQATAQIEQILDNYTSR